MLITRTAAVAGLAAAAVALTACSSSSKTDTGSSGSTAASSTSASKSSLPVSCASGALKAEGSTAQGNAMDQWIKDYQNKCSGTTVTYGKTGSGAGVSNFIAKQDDFAGSDSALSVSKGEVTNAATSCGSPALNLPMVVGPIAIAFKLQGVDTLTLTPTLIANIFLGKIATWDDAAIKAANPSAKLPSTKITVFYRSDSSGTTQNFETYLSKTVPTVFTSTPDKDGTKAGFAGQGKSGSTGVQQAISTTEGSIGYLEWSFAVSGNLSQAKVDNGGGAVELNADTAGKAVAAATDASNGGLDSTLSLDYATKVAGAYPIILVTYEIVCQKYADSAVGARVKSFLSYLSGDGQKSLKDLGYAPLPSTVLTKVQTAIAAIS